jgi:hypothetical protein
MLQAHEDIIGYESPAFIAARMGMAMHYMHIAISVLVMDFCFNRGEVDEEQVKHDVFRGIKTFEIASQSSLLVCRFLTALRDAMQRHGVYPPSDVPMEAMGGMEMAGPEHSLKTQLEAGSLMRQSSIMGAGYTPTAFDPAFDDFWQFASNSGADPDADAWAQLFVDLDTRPL